MARFGSHRNIPNVFEFFEDNGTAYIVMELLTGCTLKHYMEENGRPDMDFAIMIANEIGKALISLHEKGRRKSIVNSSRTGIVRTNP